MAGGWTDIFKPPRKEQNQLAAGSLGSYHTAWAWLQKLRRCTICKDRKKLSGRVEVDEFFIGGKKSGKRGRGAEGKTIVLVAVERDTVQDPETLNHYWQMGRVRITIISCINA